MRDPMRMAGPDIVLFVVGAVLFGGATYAITQQPGGLTGVTSAAGVFDVTFQTSEAEIGNEAVASFRSGNVAFEVDEGNVTRLTFAVVCNDPAGAAVPFSISLTLTPPAGIPAPDPVNGNCGSDISIEIDVAPAPTAASVPGSTEDEARRNLATFPNATRAVGTWTVDFTGARQGGGTPLPIPGVAGDPGGSITLTAETWQPRFAPVQR